MFASLRNLFKGQSQAPVQEPTPAPVIVSREVMDASFDRSAGRWCGTCEAHGSHHTDRHDEFARAALANATA